MMFRYDISTRLPPPSLPGLADRSSSSGVAWASPQAASRVETPAIVVTCIPARKRDSSASRATVGEMLSSPVPIVFCFVSRALMIAQDAPPDPTGTMSGLTQNLKAIRTTGMANCESRTTFQPLLIDLVVGYVQSILDVLHEK